MGDPVKGGRHVVHVFSVDERWVAALDGVLLRGWHRSRAEAWSAGLAEGERVDREWETSAGIPPGLSSATGG